MPTDPGNPVAGRNGVPGLDSPGQLVRPNSYLARRDARKTNQQPDPTVKGVPVTATSQDVRPAQFLDILGDVQDMHAGLAKAQATASYVFSQLPGTTMGASYPALISTVADPDAKPAPAAANPADCGNQPNDTAAPNPTQQAATQTLDALLETDQAAVSQAGNESQGSAASSSEVAFAARIASKATDPRVIAPNEGQAAIAASRFEGVAANDGSGKTQDNRDAAESGVLAQPDEPVPVVASLFEAMASDSGSGEPRSHAEANASTVTNSASPVSAGADRNGQAGQALGPPTQPAAQAAAGPAIAVQPATGRTHGSPANSGGIAARPAAAGQVGSSALAGPQNASSGIVAAAPSSVDTAVGPGPTNAKPAPQDHAAQNVEAPNEPAEPTAGAVHDISLNLSTKDQNVQVRLSERGGELHVTVRTPDSTLAHGLREGLSDLVGRLERGGYRAETWQPAGNDSRDRGHDSPSRRSFSQQQNAGGKGSGRQQNSQDSEPENETPKWTGELESSFQKE